MFRAIACPISVMPGENTLEIDVADVKGKDASGLMGPVTVRSIHVAQVVEQAK